MEYNICNYVCVCHQYINLKIRLVFYCFPDLRMSLYIYRWSRFCFTDMFDKPDTGEVRVIQLVAMHSLADMRHSTTGSTNQAI